MPGNAAPEDGEEHRERRTRGSSAVKSSSKVAPKKMVQARLPFKRLNPVPKEKEGLLEGKKAKAAQNTLPQNSVLDTSTEDLENDCQVETLELSPLPKTVNGKGPLDYYLKKTSKASHVSPVATIDLTEDSNIGTADQTLPNGETQTHLVNGTVSAESGPPSPLLSQESDHCSSSMETETQEKDDSSKLTVQNSNPQLTRGTLSLKLHRIAREVVEALQRSSAKMEEEDSSSEDVSGVPSSSNSSPVTVSSPEAQSDTQLKDHPSSSSTPVRKVILQKQSTEKKKLRDKEQEEKRRKLQAEKEEREKAKEEARIAKEEAKKKKDEEKEVKEKERKEKKEKEDKEKAEKLRLKEEKKKEKLEALEAKQEEKRKKDEEKRLKEEEKRMKAEKAEITRFFQKPKMQRAPKTFASSCGKFAPFEIKKNMAVAPLCRVEFEPESSEQLDQLMQEQHYKMSFLTEIKSRKPRKMGRTVVPRVAVVSSEVDEILEEPHTVLEDVMLVEPVKDNSVPERRQFGRMKLLQFCENYRPAYWGTWNRMSQVICSRKPWAQDCKLLDYEVDSDEEWEEEEPGESLSHSEGDDDDEPKEDEEDDDGFFVPHGYLSEDEGASDEECADPENQKVRQKLKAKEWDELLSKGKKFRVLQPVVVGCVWQGSDASEIRLLHKFAACILETPVAEEELAQEISAERTFKDREILSHLLPLLHGNVNGSKAIIHEFQECCRRGLFLDSSATTATSIDGISPNNSNYSEKTPINNITVPSKTRLKRIISENSVYEKRPDHRMSWYVHAHVLKSFEQDKLPVPCQWTYITQVNSVAREDGSTAGPAGGSTQTTPVSVKRKSAGSMSITKFMKRAKDLGTTGPNEADGFQADTEEEDDDCMIVESHQRKEAETPNTVCKMEVSASDAAIPASE